MDQKIMNAALKQFAMSSPDSFSMRQLAREVKVAQSVIYYYFASKQELLRSLFDRTNTNLGLARAQLPATNSVHDMLVQRIIFQFEHAQEVIAVLKYYLSFRDQFKKVEGGYVPVKAYLHIEEVLVRGIHENVFDPKMDVAAEAKVMTHAINGFLLEYYPHVPQGAERAEVIQNITTFLWRGIPKVE